MRPARLSLAGVLAALALTNCAPPAENDAEAIAAIHRLDEADRAATLSGDPAALAQLWTADAYRAEPGAPGENGIAAIQADDVASAAARKPGAGVVDYHAVITHLVVRGDVAIESGFFDMNFRRAPGEAPIPFRGNLLRVLCRQSDGSWRFSHVMWNPAAPE